MKSHMTFPAAFTQLFALLICLMASISSAASPVAPECQTLAYESGLSLQSCNSGIQSQRWMKLSVKRSKLESTTVNAIFSAQREIWDRVWVSDGSGQLSSEAQKTLQRWILNPSLGIKNSGFVPLLDVLGSFLQPGVRLEPFDRKMSPNFRQNQWDSNAFGSWTPICEAVGTTRLASFYLKGDSLRVPQLIDLPVGEPETMCRGRCGWGCAQDGLQIRHNQYTQECFNHDACHWIHHKQMGVCADAFWAAAASYVFAPDCPIRSAN